MDKIKIGVIGVGRGRTMIDYCRRAENATLVAICDFWREGLDKARNEIGDEVTYYTSYDEFLKHDMDAVVLANYATEHAPFAIKALQHGKHVLSEVLPVQTMAEAVALIEAVEQSGLTYAYAENYCFMPAPREMKKLYQEGKLGLFEYGEAEYIHNCLPIWPDITYGDKHHWRNHMYATFYATHSIGPIVHITGLRPVKVTGYEIPYGSRAAKMGKLGATAGIEMIEFENGAILKSIHGDLSKNSIWFSLYGTKGRMESAREDLVNGDVERIYLNLDSEEDAFDGTPVTYEPKDELSEIASGYGHGGSDFYTMYNFVEKLKGNQKADTIDVYEAMDMFLPGMFAYRSILEGGIPKEVPNLRIKSVRDHFRNDLQCTDPIVAKEQRIPCQKNGNPQIDDQLYEEIKQVWKSHQE
ncbi:MAG: Gfo/Idh/MocA family oxidoreductase [Candidatus Izemoplasmatales bacterium]|nr:Gfo/Idh/MocA family oxidoreductase [Candidatus Izemoplasmatales bacterium]